MKTKGRKYPLIEDVLTNTVRMIGNYRRKTRKEEWSRTGQGQNKGKDKDMNDNHDKSKTRYVNEDMNMDKDENKRVRTLEHSDFDSGHNFP